jgi:cupin 2 domain-containing protein
VTTERGNLFSSLPAALAEEQITALLTAPDLRIERIVSRGQASPPGFWYDQAWAEWVTVLAGSAVLTLDGEAAPIRLARGDYLHIPAHCRHRVEWTDPDEATVWLAVHWPEVG